MILPRKQLIQHTHLDINMAVSTPVPVANRTLAYRALESGLHPHELKIDRPRTVRAQLN